MSTTSLFTMISPLLPVLTAIVAAQSQALEETLENAMPTKASASVEYSPNSSSLARRKILRVSSFDTALNRRNEGELRKETRSDDVDQLQRVAAILEHIEADIVLVNEFDYYSTGGSYKNFRRNYLRVPQTKYFSTSGVEYPYFYAAPTSTGVLSGVNINSDGKSDLPKDAYGFGFFPGQFAFVVYSKYEILESELRTFQNFLWKD